MIILILIYWRKRFLEDKNLREKERKSRNRSNSIKENREYFKSANCAITKKENLTDPC